MSFLLGVILFVGVIGRLDAGLPWRIARAGRR
jgi:hypothetical protein